MASFCTFLHSLLLPRSFAGFVVDDSFVRSSYTRPGLVLNQRNLLRLKNMKLNHNLVLALSFGALKTAHAGFVDAHPRGKPLITSSSIVSPPPLSIVTIPCNTTTSAGTSAPPFSIPQNTSSPSPPSVTAVGTITVPCIKCPESTGPPITSPPTITTITTTTFVTVPCSSEVESVSSQPVLPVIVPPLNTAPTIIVPPQNTGPAVPAFPSGPLVPSKAVPTLGGEVSGASNTEIPSPPSSSVPIAPAPPAASSRPAGPASPQPPAPSPTGPPRPPTFTGAASALAVNPRGTVMALIVAALAIF